MPGLLRGNACRATLARRRGESSIRCLEEIQARCPEELPHRLRAPVTGRRDQGGEPVAARAVHVGGGKDQGLDGLPISQGGRGVEQRAARAIVPEIRIGAASEQGLDPGEPPLLGRGRERGESAFATFVDVRAVLQEPPNCPSGVMAPALESDLSL